MKEKVELRTTGKLRSLSKLEYERLRPNKNALPESASEIFASVRVFSGPKWAAALAIIVALYRARQTTHVEDLRSLKF